MTREAANGWQSFRSDRAPKAESLGGVVSVRTEKAHPREPPAPWMDHQARQEVNAECG